MTMKPLPTPQPDALNDAKGQTTSTGYRYLESLGKSARTTVDAVNTITARSKEFGAAITYVENRDYFLEIKASEALRIDEIISYCVTGTCTATVKIAGVTVTATANAVSNTVQTRVPTANNLVPAGTYVTVTITANASCEYAVIKCKCSYQ